MRRLAGFLIAVSVACSGTPSSRHAPTPAPAPVAPTGPHEAGLLAGGRGKTGLVQVVEREGLRLLLIDGVVQAAVPAGGGASGPDPMVRLLREARPLAKRVLVVGLGSGRTAGELAAAGLEVTAVEIEPLVVQYAKEYFGYRGQAVVGDGVEYLKGLKHRRFDLVLLDAPALANKATLELALAAVIEGEPRHGLVGARTVDRPTSPAIAELLVQRHRPERAFVQALGSGVGDEPQNLYLLVSEGPIDVTADPTTPLHPLTQPGTSDGARVPPAGEVTVLGYLSRVGPNQTLVLDLPHWEMGAIRYVLSGAAAAPLEAKAPRGGSYPTDGEIGSDGDVSRTLIEMISGGGVKRSDVHFSAVAALVQGKARFRASLDPDSVFGGRRLEPKQPGRLDPLLPYGGVLYELEVAEVPWTFDYAAWSALQKQVAPALDRAAREARSGRLPAAAAAFGQYADGLAGGLGPAAAHVMVARDAARLRATLQLEAGATGLFATGAACDRASEDTRVQDYVQRAAMTTMREALVRCAEAHYQKRAIADTSEEARVAASRLLVLWDQMSMFGWMPAKKAADLDKKMRVRFPHLAEVYEAPR